MKNFLTTSVLLLALALSIPIRAAQISQGTAGARALNILTINTNVNDAETFTVSGQVFELDLRLTNRLTSGNVRVDLGTNGTRASDVLTFTNQVANREQITVDGKTYQFDTTLTNTDGHVLIGATMAGSIVNLYNAINLGTGSGTSYASAMTAPTNVYASASNGTTLTLTALDGGSQGNALAVSRAWATNTGWATATLASGVGPNPATDPFLVTNIVRAFNQSNKVQMAARVMNTNQILFFNLYPGNPSNACSEAIAGATFAAATTFGGLAADPILTQTVVSRVPTANEVTLGQMQFVFPFTPRAAFVSVITTSTGASVAWDGVRLISGNVLTIDNSGSTDWAATSTVNVMVSP